MRDDEIEKLYILDEASTIFVSFLSNVIPTKIVKCSGLCRVIYLILELNTKIGLGFNETDVIKHLDAFKVRI